MYRDIPSTINEMATKLLDKLDHIYDENYNPGAIPITRLKNWVRESYQDLYRQDIKTIMTKLKQRQQLSDEEMKIMELWMIGDLENYTKLERHYQNWINSLKENIKILQSLNEPTIHQNSEKLLRIQGLIMEIEHILHELEQYQYIMDRIRRYKSYVGIDTTELNDTRRFELAQILQEMLNSPLH